MPESELNNLAEFREKLKKIVTRAILLDEQNKVLLGKRVRGGGVGKWALIGGKPEGNESPEEAVKREVKEELNIDFNPIFFETIEDQQSPDRSTEEQHIWDMYVYYGKFQGIPTFKTDEISEIALVSEEELENFDLAFNHKEILYDFFKKEKKEVI